MLSRILAIAVALSVALTVVPAAELTPSASASLCEDVQCQLDRAKSCVQQAKDDLREKDYVGAVACEQPA